MHNVEWSTFLEFDGFFVCQYLPQKIQRRALEAAVIRPCNLQTGQIYPDKAEVIVGMLRKKLLDAIAVVRIRQDANLMNDGKLPGEIPCDAGFRAGARTASVSNEQNSHVDVPP
jgi:hypothetical protein